MTKNSTTFVFDILYVFFHINIFFFFVVKIVSLSRVRRLFHHSQWWPSSFTRCMSTVALCLMLSRGVGAGRWANFFGTGHRQAVIWWCRCFIFSKIASTRARGMKNQIQTYSSWRLISGSLSWPHGWGRIVTLVQSAGEEEEEEEEARRRLHIHRWTRTNLNLPHRQYGIAMKWRRIAWLIVYTFATTIW